MAVGIARILVMSCNIVGFQGFLDGLVTEESHIELMPCLVQVFSSADVLVYVVEPLLNDVLSCHIRVVLFAYGCKDTKLFGINVRFSPTF